MLEKDLKFDRSRHMIYSKAVRTVIRDRLSACYPAPQAETIWEQVQLEYVRILDEIPYLGGSKNFQAGAVYDCAALFAYYLTVPDKPSLEEFQQMNEALFVPTFERLPFVNLNRSLEMKAAGCIWTALSRSNARHRDDWPGNYHMEMCEVPEGKKYIFSRCPIAELARRLGCTHLMSAMCNPDYPMLEQIHGGLIRTSTCAFGPCCDFWIVGSDSPLLQKYPKVKNEEGFWYNKGPGSPEKP